jgi:signal peptidase I
MAEVFTRTTSSPKRKVLFTGFGVFLLFVLAFAIFFFLQFQTVQVSGPSMQPTLEPGRRVLTSSAYWLVGEIQKGDIIVVRSPKDKSIVIKRVYALQGDVVDFLNAPESWPLGSGEFRVPENSYYVLGDNKPVSEDSREFGPVPKSQVLGKVVVWNTPG